jgi:hypothetical protein
MCCDLSNDQVARDTRDPDGVSAPDIGRDHVPDTLAHADEHAWLSWHYAMEVTTGGTPLSTIELVGEELGGVAAPARRRWAVHRVHRRRVKPVSHISRTIIKSSGAEPVMPT